MKLVTSCYLLLQAVVFAALAVTETKGDPTAYGGNGDLYLFVSMDDPACMKVLGKENKGEITMETPIPEPALVEDIFEEGFDFLLSLTGAIDFVSVNDPTLARKRNLREREERELICSQCQKASNWRRCVKNNCRRRRGRQLQASISVDDLRVAADKIRGENGMDRRLSIGAGEDFTVDHDRALLQETINEAINTADHPCPLDFSLLFPELDEMQETKRKKKAIATLAAGRPVCDKENLPPLLVSECSHLGECKQKYGHLAPYDCRNENRGVCYCGDNEVCGCIEDKPNTCPNKDDFKGECKTTKGCRAKYADAVKCNGREDGICYCGAGEVCGCKHPTCDIPKLVGECRNGKGCRDTYGSMPEFLGITNACTDGVCYCEKDYNMYTPCGCYF